jgi:hypothetical protein
MVNVTHENIAKLLSTENINVFQKNVDTAYFDTVNRSLIIPMWDKLSEAEIQMLISHEIGHALFTPADEWAEHKDRPVTFRSILNIVEDARIEILTKKKYPGIKKIFTEGYVDISKRSFIKDNLSKLSFIDVINYWYKFNIIFPLSLEKDHWYFIDKINKVSSFEEVVIVSEEIFEYYQKQKKSQDQLPPPPPPPPPPSQENDMDSDSDSEEQENDSDSEEQENDSDSEEQENDSDSEEQENDSDSEEQENDSDSEGDRSVESDFDSDGDQEESVKAQSDSDSSSTETYDNSTNKERDIKFEEPISSDLIDSELSKTLSSKSGNAYYINIPETILENVVIPPFEIMNDYTEHAKLTGFDGWEKEFSNSKLLNHIEKNKNFINYYKNIFDRKKSATSFYQEGFKKTGKIDPNKLFSYKIDENIFKSMITVKEGKNHSLVFIMDLSGSVTDYLFGMKKKVVELITFCRSANISYVVYGFSDNTHDSGKPSGFVDNNIMDYYVSDRSGNSVFKMFEIFNSSMSLIENKKMICVFENMIGRSRFIYNNHNADMYEKLGAKYCLYNTPLELSYLCLEKIVEKMQKVYNSEIINVIYLTDGQGTFEFLKNPLRGGDPITFNYYNEKNSFYYYDNKRKKMFKFDISNYSEVLLDVIKSRLPNINVLNFFITYPLNKFFSDKEIMKQFDKKYDSKIHNISLSRYQNIKLKEDIFRDCVFLYEKPERGFDEVIFINYEIFTNKFISSILKNDFKNQSIIKKKKEKLITRFIDLVA